MQEVLDKLATTRDSLDDIDDQTPVLIEWDKGAEEHWFEDYDEDGVMEGTVWMPTIKVTKDAWDSDYHLSVSIMLVSSTKAPLGSGLSRYGFSCIISPSNHAFSIY
jgi:hypothetical protein